MTSKIVAAGLAVLLGTVSMAPAPVAAAEVSTAAWQRVPLPVPRPGSGARVMYADAGSAAGATGSAVAPAPDGSSLKTGSSEALAIQYTGAKVVLADGTVVGEVERVVEDAGPGPLMVVGLGGVLGIGARHVLVPVSALVPSGEGMVRTGMTLDELRGLPAYQKD